MGLAWQVALQACRDFLDEGHEIDIVFAVLNEGLLRLGLKTLDGIGPRVTGDA